MPKEIIVVYGKCPKCGEEKRVLASTIPGGQRAKCNKCQADLIEQRTTMELTAR